MINPTVVNYFNFFLGISAILLQVFSVFILFLLIFYRQKNIFLDFVSKNFLILGFIISLASVVFSLIYSEIIGFLPCSLCWYQRIFLFPVVFIFMSAIWAKDRNITRYVLPLLSLGALVSLNQNFFYYFKNSSNLPCDASGVSCFQQLVSVFGGYISIPMLSLTSFFSLIVVVLVGHFYNKEN